MDTGLKQIDIIKERQTLAENKIQKLRNELICNYNSNLRDIEVIKNQLSKATLQYDEDIVYVFHAPQPNPWFCGRECQIEELKSQLREKEEQANGKKKVAVAAICGLGGSGKSSLVVEYAQRMKDLYQGGVFWISGEDDIHLESSVNSIAMNFGTFQHDSFDLTLTGTLLRISRIRKPWLIVVDDMDELHLSQNVTKIISGSWQHGVGGHVVITTRRKPSALANDVGGFQESSCVQLECFDPNEAKDFLLKRTGIIQCDDEETNPVAESLVSELGGLPLALEQAGALIKSLRCSLSSYLESYKAQRLNLLSEKSPVTRVSDCESPDRLAVTTTWLLNLEHIRQSIGGANAIRFLNACAFISPHDIQQELINVGEPIVEDEHFREFVGTTLGCQQVLKMLTDFSLFKESENRCLSVHRLVQEVVLENLSPDEKAESLVDSVRFLNYAFLKCPSPDELLTRMSDGQRQSVSVNLTDPSRFHQWSILCLHTHEIRKNVEKLVKKSTKSTEKSIFFQETARIVYECALHLGVNCRQKEAKETLNFAYRILHWAVLVERDLSPETVQALFPHILPLPSLVSRHIQYSCKAPDVMPATGGIASEHISLDPDQSKRLENMRFQGNQHFKESRFKESIEFYSSAIKMSKSSNLFDPMFLSNRASAYLKLGQYESALKDAENYIRQCPECWRGYARKALALNGLKEEVPAKLAAALAFYRDRSLFREFQPFKKEFPELENCISVCGNSSELVSSLPSATLRMSTAKVDKILVLKPWNFLVSAESVDCSKIYDDDLQRLIVGSCFLLGVESGVTLSFQGSFSVLFQTCMAANLTFRFDQGNCYADFRSFVKLSNCSFSSQNKSLPGFSTKGQLNVDNCSFKNCKGGGLLVGGIAEVNDSVFSGNGSAGLEVCEGGRLKAKNCGLYGNKQGLLIGPEAGMCSVLDCQVYDNVCEGIVLTESTDVTLSGNHIFHNEHYGISLDNKSFSIISRNEIFENWWWGISTGNNSWCHISRNSIYGNKCGGVHAVPLAACEPKIGESCIEFNNICENGGPGIDENVTFPERQYHPKYLEYLSNPDELKKAKCEKNQMVNNIPQGSQSAHGAGEDNFCYFCHEKGSLKKCKKCFTAEYCNIECQKGNWEKHKTYCPSLLKKSSIVLQIVPKTMHIGVNFHASNLQPVGPAYAPAPECGTRFIVKIQARGSSWKQNNSPLLHVYDRSFFVKGDFDDIRIYDLVRQFGINCEDFIWKKMFFWALLRKSGKLRVFVNKFPPNEFW